MPTVVDRNGLNKMVGIGAIDSNKNHNHDLKKYLYGSRHWRAAATAGPFQKFYEARLANGMKPPMARLTLARKIRTSLCSFGRKEFVSTLNN